MNPDTIAPSVAACRDPAAAASNAERLPFQPNVVVASRTTVAQKILIVLSAIAFLYFARPVVLPIVLACAAGMTLKPLIRWLSRFHIPPAVGTAAVLGLFVAVVGIGFVQLGRPALAWMNEAPEHTAKLGERVRKLFPRVARLNATSVNQRGTNEERQIKAPSGEARDSRGAAEFISWSGVNWTGSLLAELCETLVLLYLLLASGDLFLLKLVQAMPTLGDKKRAVEISHEIQQNISNYLFTVSLINVGLGIVVSGGLFWLDVPNAPMWGMLVALLNYIPYFGPIVGIILLSSVGLLSFDTLLRGLLPAIWYLLLHLMEANLVTPVMLGRRFTLNPVVIFVSLIFWTWLWGVPGALLSVPILVSIKVMGDRVPAMSHVSELLTR